MTTTRTERVYLYHRYERLWHWVQALTITLLLVSGAAIRFTGSLPLSLSLMTRVHEWTGLVMAANALLGLLYHLFTGEIWNFVPRFQELFGRVGDQVRFYLSGTYHY